MNAARRFCFPLIAVLGLAARVDAEPQRSIHETPGRRFDIQHRELHVRFDLARRSIAGRITLAGRALAPCDALVLDARELEVRGVTDSVLGPLAFETAEGHLTVRFPHLLARDQLATVTIEYTAAPRAGLYWIGPDQDHPGRRAEVWSQGEVESARFWFPDFDEPVERAATDLYYTVPAPLFALGNGRLVARSAGPEAGEITYHWQEPIPFPSYLVMVAAGTFAKVDTLWRGIPVEYYVPPGMEERVRRSMGRTPEMMEFFSGLLGVPYPYEKYAQVVVQDFTFGGMENLSATTMTERLLLDRTAALERESEGLVAHELAHQWFGDLVTCREWAHAWLNEGFATFLADLWREHAAGRDEMDRSLLEERGRYFETDLGGRRPVVEPNYRLAQELFNAQTYQRGAWVLHLLRRRLGDGPFLRGLHLYLERNAGQSVDTDVLRYALEEASGEGLDGFFTQWVERAGYPELRVSWRWLDDRKLARIALEQTQPSDSLTPLYRFDLPIRFALGSGEIRSTLHVDGRTAETYVALPERPRYVEVNDDLSVLARITFERDVPSLVAQLESAPLGASRIEAARALGDRGVREAIAALSAALGADRFWAVRAAAAEALGRIPSPAGLEALGPGLRDTDARVRRVAVAALAGFAGFTESSRAADWARAALSDPAYGVVAAGLGALTKLRAPEAHAELVKALERPSFNDTIRTAALSGLAELGDPRALPLLIQRTRARESLPVRLAAVDALGKLGRSLQAEPSAGRTSRRDARLALEPLLWDEKMRVRQRAAEALGALGDREGIGALDRLLGRECEEAVLATAIDGRAKLRGAAEPGAGPLKAEIERLKEAQRALETRIKALEGAERK